MASTVYLRAALRAGRDCLDRNHMTRTNASVETFRRGAALPVQTPLLSADTGGF
jgi:hypothetical protein